MAAMVAQQLEAAQACDIAQAMMDGVNRHYQLFRAASQAAKQRFEQADWASQQRAQRERIAFYDQRLQECVQRLNQEFAAGSLPVAVWAQVKRHYIGLMVEHLQPELAETFFNSVITRILHRSYFRNDFMFVRPVVSTEYLESAQEPAYRAYYPGTLAALPQTLQHIVQQLDLQCGFAHLEADAEALAQRIQQRLQGLTLRANFQIQVLSGLFYRNKGAYLVGKIITGYTEVVLAVPILHTPQGLVLHAALFGEEDLHGLFSFARAYFMVDMAVPSAYVEFLHGLMPRKPRGEIYSALGLAKQGKTLFYREFLHHLKHSSDQFRVSPGIKGLVMLVFDLPSFPYVFKLIKDKFPAPKDTTRAQVQAKYQLVKQHDRVGRMADTMEYSLAAFPRERFSEALLHELHTHAPSLLEVSGRGEEVDDGDSGPQDIIIRHLYIERRLLPLNMFLQECFDAGLEHPAPRQALERAVIEYGNAIKELVAANIFPGDMLWKNFGVTRGGKVVFYDYDEIEYHTDCHFRAVPQPRTEEEAMSSQIWWRVGPKDVFPETFAPFLLGHPVVREVFMQHHADLLSPAFWQAHQARIAQGEMHDVFPYDRSRCLYPAAGD